MRTLGLITAFALAGALASCSGRTSDATRLGVARATLRRATSCADLEQALKQDALAKMNQAIDAQIRAVRRGGYGVAFAGTAEGGTAVPKDSGTPTASNGATSHSDTNTQVAGVDEADLVKTDGKYIYLLHGRELVVLDAWPASALAKASSIAIEGEPTEMFQWNDKIVVYSTVDGTPVYAATGLAPRTTFGELAYGGATDIAVAPTTAGMPMPYGTWMASPLAKITVLDVANGSATVTRETYFEGTYLSSRRIGKQVRTIFQGAAPGPQIKSFPDMPAMMKEATSSPAPGSAQEQEARDAWISAYEALRQSNTAAIAASTVSDWVPYTFARTSAGVTATPLACEDFYLPTQGTTRYGLTHVETFDAENPSSPLKTAAIVGQADTVYANEKAMILAAHAWLDPEVYERAWWGERGGAQTLSTDSTHLHAFDITTDPSAALYVASGTVPGSVQNQFSLDERAGVVRVTTTEHKTTIVPQGATVPPATPRSANHVFTLRESAGELALVGSVGDLAPGETIMSTRFVGDTAYVVTYLQKDPLFVVDLKDAAAPRVLGQLTIPGFSSYMHPLDDAHLLTIGQDGGLALQIFDVTNPAAPVQSHKFVYTNEYGYSEAQSNHKAFTYFAERKLLAFPFVAYGSSAMKSTLELFHVDAQTGIDRIGAIDHTSFFGATTAQSRGYCGGYFEPAVRRGVFLDDVVFSVSYGGVIANDATTLQPIASLALPVPELPEYPGCAGQPKPTN